MTVSNEHKITLLRDLIANGHIQLSEEKLSVDNILFEDSILDRNSFEEDANNLRIRFFLENPDVKPLFISRNQLKKIPAKFVLLKEKDSRNSEHGNLIVALLHFFDFVGVDYNDNVFMGRFKVKQMKEKVVLEEPINREELTQTVDGCDKILDSFGNEYLQIRLF